MRDCPSADLLRGLLDQSLTAPDRVRLEAHVEDCPLCQESLEGLTRDTSLLPGARAEGRSAAEAADGPFLRRLIESPPEGSSRADTPFPEGRPGPEIAPAWPAVRGFEIVGELGRGGMGVVYEARQQRPHRLVALKMILAGAHAGADYLARFRREAEAVAGLRHPNIVQLYEVGEQDGRPYFSLEHVDGGSLARRLGGRPRPGAEAARLVEALARAVHFAHQHGIIHRDLKPANVLLTADGTPKIADFGLAKWVGVADRAAPAPPDDTPPTTTGAVMGTPSYMSPEQARGDAARVGPATDVYALGAILYELLTGRPPFQGETPLDTLRQIQTEEPVRPRRVEPKVARDLEVICLKCLEKEPSRRYASALGLAEDLGRFLRHEPIRARPSPPWVHAWKWVRRRPALATLLAVSAAALLCLVVAEARNHALLQDERDEARYHEKEALRAREEERQAHIREGAARGRAEEKEKEARAQRDKVREWYARARATVDALLTEIGYDELAPVPHMTGVRRRLVEKALQYYLEFLKEKGDDPEIRAETARAYARVADLRQMLGDDKQAEVAARAAVALLEGLAGELGGQPRYERDLAGARHNLGYLLKATGRLAEAEAAFHDAVRRQRRLAERYPAEPVYRLDLSHSHNNLGLVLQAAGQLRTAADAFRTASDLGRELVAQFPDTATYQRVWATSLSNEGNLFRGRGRPQEAEKAHRKALELRRALVQRFPDSPLDRNGRATSHNNRAFVLMDTGRLKDAEEAFWEALRGREPLARDFPERLDYHRELSATRHNLSVLLASRGRFEEALKLSDEALAAQQKLADGFPGWPVVRQELARAFNHRGTLLWSFGRPADAEAAFRRALANCPGPDAEVAAGPEARQEAAAFLHNLGNVLYHLKRLPEAEEFCRRAAAAMQALAKANPDFPQHRQGEATSRDTLGSVLEELRRPAEAEQEFRIAIALREELARRCPDVPEYLEQAALSQFNLGNLFLRTRRWAMAGEAYGQAAGRLRKLRAAFADRAGYRHELSVVQNSAGMLFFNTQKYPAAAEALGEAADLQRDLVKAFPTVLPYRLALARTLNNLGVLYKATDRPETAEQVYRGAAAQLTEIIRVAPKAPEYREQWVQTRTNLGNLFLAEGRADEAEAEYRAAWKECLKLAGDFPRVRSRHSLVGKAADKLVGVLLAREQWEEARPVLEQSARHLRLARAGHPAAAEETSLLRQHLDHLAEMHLRRGDHAAAARAAEELPQLAPDEWQGYWAAARCLGRCLPLLGGDADLDDRQRADRGRAYADRAVALLRAAVARGLPDAGALEKEPAFAALRARADFRQLVKEVREAKRCQDPF